MMARGWSGEWTDGDLIGERRLRRRATRHRAAHLHFGAHIMAAATATDNAVTLKGSVATVAEFFEYSVNNILYQREIYPPESFRRVAKYGLAMFVTTDDGLAGYLSNVLVQLHGACLRCRHRRLEEEKQATLRAQRAARCGRMKTAAGCALPADGLAVTVRRQIGSRAGRCRS